MQFLLIWRYFRIDNIECADPGTIEGLSYFNFVAGMDHPMQGKTFEKIFVSLQGLVCKGFEDGNIWVKKLE